MEHERRRHTRHSISLAAEITTADGKTHAAAVKDFCLGGLFVACRALADNERVDEGAPLRVNFAVPIEGVDHEFEVATCIARILPGGIGVNFMQSDIATLKALRALATYARQMRKNQGTSARLTVPTEAVVSGVDPAMLDASRVLERCKSIVADYLTANIQALYKRADEKLAQTCTDAIGTAEEGRCFHAMWELNNLQSTIHMSLRAHILSQLDQLIRPTGRGPGAEDPDEMEDLSLVDTQNFSDWLAIKAILEEAETRTAQSCDSLERSLSALVQAPVDENSNPVGPTGICAAFHDAVHDLWLSPVAREPLFEAFRETMMANLDGLYAELNALFQAHAAPGQPAKGDLAAG